MWAPDATLHCYAFVVPGNDHTSIVPEDWNGWLPPHPDDLPPEREPTPKKSKKDSKKKKRPPHLKITEEVSKRLQSQLQSATRGVSLRKIFSKHDTDRSGTLTATELKKMIRKELRITTALVSDRDVEDLAAALDGDHTGNISIEELLSFIERGSATFFRDTSSNKETSLMEDSSVRDQEVPKSRDSTHSDDDDDTDASEKKAPAAAPRPSKSVLASTREPYNRFVYRPLTPPQGGSLITMSPLSSREHRARKASLVSRPKEPQRRGEPRKKDEETASESKGAAKTTPPVALHTGGSAYWLRGLSRARGNPMLPPQSARGAHSRGARPQGSGRGLPAVKAPKVGAPNTGTPKPSEASQKLEQADPA